MGLSYSNCSLCEEIFVDGFDELYCDECGTTYCAECVDTIGIECEDEDDEIIKNCPVCHYKKATQYEIRDYMLKKLDMTRDEIEQEILKTKKEDEQK